MIQVYVNGVEITNLVLVKSLTWEQVLTYEMDSLTFLVQKFGSRTFAPAIFDEVTMYIDSDKVFGGNIVDIRQEVEGVDRLVYEVTVKDYSHIFDRFLIQERFENKPVVNIICEILNRYANKNERVQIADFETNEVWQGDGVPDITNYRTGDQGWKLASTSGATVYADRTLFLDLSADSDYMELDVWVDDITKLESVVLKLGDTSLTNYYSKDITALLTVSGANYVRFLKSTFTTNGSPSWADLDYQKIEVKALTGENVEVTLDNWQVNSYSAFTRANAMTATQEVKGINFNLEAPTKAMTRLANLFAWQWYIDQDRDIHFFAKFEEGAAFDLSDTNRKYEYRTLVWKQSADQLRNSIYVRGGKYLGDAITEALSDQVDGSTKILKVGYVYDHETIDLTDNAVELAVGLEGNDGYTGASGSSQKSYGLTTLNVGDATGNERQSLQVICEKKGRRTGLKIRVRKVGAPVDNFQLQIFSDNGSEKPSSTNLSALYSIAGSSLATTMTEINPAFTEAGANTLLFDIDDKYHVVATRSGVNDPSNYYQIDVYSDVYEGRTYKSADGVTWTAQQYDWYFVESLSFEVLYNPDEKVLKWNTAPTAGHTVSVTAQPQYQVLIQYKDNSSVATYGEYQFKIIDETIESLEAARQRGLEEVLQWASSVSEISFKTLQTGLFVGQTINIQSDVRGIDVDCFINRIVARANSFQRFEYSIQCVTTKTMGILYWLQSQINQNDKLLAVDESELLSKIEGVTDSFSVTDSVSVTSYTGKVWSEPGGTTPNALVWSGGADDIWV